MKHNLTFIFNDLVGGVATMNFGIINQSNLCSFFNVRIILIRNQFSSKHFLDLENIDNRIEINIFEYSTEQNNYYVLRKLNKLINKYDGFVITNDGVELQALRLLGTKNIVFHIVHDLYNFQLGLNNRDVIDYYICHTIEVYRLLLTDPNLKCRVTYLPFGVNINVDYTILMNKNRPLVITAVARLVKTKNIHLLIDIDKLLKEKNILVEWKIVGDGPEKKNIQNQWKNNFNVQFISPNNDQLIEILKVSNIFISLSEFEGYGIALLESLSFGLLPIITKLPIGIHSVIPSSFGFVMDEIIIKKIASFIEDLDNDRDLLYNHQKNALHFVTNNFNSLNTSKQFLNFFKQDLIKYCSGSKMNFINSFGIFDKRWLPNFITVLFKKLKNIYAIS